jgi:hypothetical protein
MDGRVRSPAMANELKSKNARYRPLLSFTCKLPGARLHGNGTPILNPRCLRLGV